jgi:hypothetical protein
MENKVMQYLERRETQGKLEQLAATLHRVEQRSQRPRDRETANDDGGGGGRQSDHRHHTSCDGSNEEQERELRELRSRIASLEASQQREKRLAGLN